MKIRAILLATFFSAVFSSHASGQSFDIKPIPDQIVPYPHALLLPFQIDGDVNVGDIEFSYQSNIDDAIIQGQSIYWKPEMEDVGRHRIEITATAPNGQTAGTRFMVEVRSFNAPPRFIPIRRISVPVGIPYRLPIKALDPDGMNKNLIRYLGVNLPNGATINEQTGIFKWEPSARQIGENTFRVIATDQFGAASSIDVTIRVIQVLPTVE